MSLHELTASQALAKLRAKEISSEELTRDILDRIKAVDGKVQAYLSTYDDTALQHARQADKQIADGTGGPLCGLPIALKDNMHIKGQITTCASKILPEFHSPFDSTVAAKLRDAGAVFIGKTNLDEFAMGSSTENSAYQQTKNPWNLDCVPGGSSGGSAAAVAANTAITALGSDTGGSIRQPAGFCGVYGLKPTYGRISRYGLVAFASSLDQIGPIGKTAEDCAIILNHIAGKDDRDSTSADVTTPDFTAGIGKGVKGLKIGIPKEYFIDGLDPEVRAAVEKAIEKLTGEGAEAVEISLPHTEYAIATYYIVCTAEASSNLARYDGVHYGFRAPNSTNIVDMYTHSRSQGFGNEVKRRIMLGTYTLSAGFYDAYYMKALRVRTLLQQDFDNAFEKCDIIVSPTSPTPAFKIGEKTDDPLKMYLDDIFTVSANLAGIPGISCPCGFTKNGLPIGIQFLAPNFKETRLIQTAHTHQNLNQQQNNRTPEL